MIAMPPSLRSILFGTATLLLLFVGARPDLRAQDQNLGVAVIVGESHAWMLEAPEGWRLDAAGARSVGVGAAFTPEGVSWEKAPAVMYANGIPKLTADVTLKSVVGDDSLRALARDPGARVVTAEPLETIEGTVAQVRHFISADTSSYEAVAYIDGPTVVALVVLSVGSKEEFETVLPSFARLVDSYEWVTSDPAKIDELRRHR